MDLASVALLVSIANGTAALALTLMKIRDRRRSRRRHKLRDARPAIDP